MTQKKANFCVYKSKHPILIEQYNDNGNKVFSTANSKGADKTSLIFTIYLHLAHINNNERNPGIKARPNNTHQNAKFLK